MPATVDAVCPCGDICSLYQSPIARTIAFSDIGTLHFSALDAYVEQLSPIEKIRTLLCRPCMFHARARTLSAPCVFAVLRDECFPDVSGQDGTREVVRAIQGMLSGYIK